MCSEVPRVPQNLVAKWDKSPYSHGLVNKYAPRSFWNYCLHEQTKSVNQKKGKSEGLPGGTEEGDGTLGGTEQVCG
jgi:hypothetical protein